MDLVEHTKRELLKYFIKKIDAYFKNKQNPLFHLWLACSAGKDSMALLLACLKILKKEDDGYFLAGKIGDKDYKIFFASVGILYFNHATRPSCDAEESYLSTLAQKLNFSFRTKRWLRNEGETFTEEDAREARYTFFNDFSKEFSIDESNKLTILLAHHQQDQVETILQRVMRGCSLQGFLGIQEERDFYLRPFLQVSQEAILAFLAEEEKKKTKIGNINLKDEINIFFDESNNNLDFQRNWLRHDLLPRWREKAPKLDAHLLNLRDDLADLFVWLKPQLAELKRKELKINTDPFYYEIDRYSLARLPRFLKTLFLKEILLDFFSKNLNRSFLKSCIDVIDSREYKFFTYKNLVFLADLDKIFLFREGSDISSLGCPPVFPVFNSQFIVSNDTSKYIYLDWRFTDINYFRKNYAKYLINNLSTDTSSFNFNIYLVGKHIQILYNEKSYTFALNEIELHAIAERKIKLETKQNDFFCLRTPKDDDWYLKDSNLMDDNNVKKKSFNKWLKKHKISNRYRRQVLVLAKGSRIYWSVGEYFL